MSNVWVIADLHLNHAKVLEFEASRNHFRDIKEHDDEILLRLHQYVRPDDVLLILGDLYFGKADDYFESCMRRIPGKPQLIMGNHDHFEHNEYLQWFTRISAYKQKYGMIFSHIPIHPSSMDRWDLNVHGHLHSEKVQIAYRQRGWDTEVNDTRYLCVSVETKAPEIGRPWHIDEIKQKFKDTR